MWPYFLMYLAPASVALAGEREISHLSIRRVRPDFSLYLYTVVMVILAGLRFEVGGDWHNYLGYLNRVSYLDLNEALAAGLEPGYYLANHLGIQLGIGIFGPNLICSILFFSGLVAFCQSMPRPWLAMAVAIPYLGIVVGMGYSRQAAALGLIMFAYRSLRQASTVKFALFVLAAATFHKTAVVVLPLAILASATNRLWSAVWLGVVAIVGYRVSLESSIDQMVSSYVDGEMQSGGALIRLAMNALPAAIFLKLKKQLGLSLAEERLWYWISLISLGLFAALLVKSSMSTAVDRIALYFLPIQIVVFSRLPGCLQQSWRMNASQVVSLALAYYAAVLVIWLNFATNAYAWEEYKFLLP